MARVLIIEGDPQHARALAMRLSAMAHDVDVATDVEAAVAELALGRPDLLVIDVSIPRADGISVVKQLRAAPATHAIPVVFITGTRDPSFRDQARKLGAVAFLDKPFSADTLSAAIMQVVKRSEV